MLFEGGDGSLLVLLVPLLHLNPQRFHLDSVGLIQRFHLGSVGLAKILHGFVQSIFVCLRCF